MFFVFFPPAMGRVISLFGLCSAKAAPDDSQFANKCLWLCPNKTFWVLELELHVIRMYQELVFSQFLFCDHLKMENPFFVHRLNQNRHGLDLASGLWFLFHGARTTGRPALQCPRGSLLLAGQLTHSSLDQVSASRWTRSQFPGLPLP